MAQGAAAASAVCGAQLLAVRLVPDHCRISFLDESRAHPRDRTRSRRRHLALDRLAADFPVVVRRRRGLVAGRLGLRVQTRRAGPRRSGGADSFLKMPLPASTLELQRVVCRGDRTTLREVNLVFDPRTFHALSGDAGCTALLRIAGLLDLPEAGEVLVEGIPAGSLGAEARGDLRNRRFGYVYHAPYLLPSMTVVENVAVPLFKIAGAGLDEARARTQEVLEFTALGASSGIAVGELSSSDQQRVALARGLVHGPAFLLVDHASNGACPEVAGRFFDLLRAVPIRFGITVIAVVPESFVPAGNDRLIVVRGGVVREELRLLPEREISRS